MDAGYLSQKVNTIIGQLHGLFDDMGVAAHDRERREAELFAAMSETLNKQVQSVTAEKQGMVEEASRLRRAVRQMEAALDDSQSPRSCRPDDDEDMPISYPLSDCLKLLGDKYNQIARLHRERFEQVKKLAQALESYSSHLEPTFVQVALPPSASIKSLPPGFDLSPSYVDKLDDEFTRVYEEYTRRVGAVRSLSEDIIQLWAELGTPQAQTDHAIVKYYRDAPEQLGLHEEDVARLRARRDKLSEEKKNREGRLRDLKTTVEGLWEKLGVEGSQRKAFLNGNRGCGLRQINEFEDELSRLKEAKRQNMHLFVEEARFQLQQLWDALFYSEDEMLDFSPAFSDVYSDALLEAHEREVGRLQALREQRGPMLEMIEKHRGLVHDRDELAASSQDASRLMMRGQKGEKRDPGKLLREEKLRKRIAKDLPKLSADLRKVLDEWEEEYGRPFLVHGERYLDQLEVDDPKHVPASRSKTPGAINAPPSTVKRSNTTATIRGRDNAVHIDLSNTETLKRSRSNHVSNNLSKGPALSRPKTPAASAQGDVMTSIRLAQTPKHVSAATRASPTRIPARTPLCNLFDLDVSPERRRPESRARNRPESRAVPESRAEEVRAQLTLRPAPQMDRAPPPKMRDLLPGPATDQRADRHRPAPLHSSVIRAVESDDVYDERASHSSYSSYASSHRSRGNERGAQAVHPQPAPAPAPAPARQTSSASTVTSGSVASGSENWETYEDDFSEPEPDACDTYYAKVRAAAQAHGAVAGEGHAKRPRGIPAPPSSAAAHGVMEDADGNRIPTGSTWTDEDGCC